jgi:CBS domain-containing protein
MQRLVLGRRDADTTWIREVMTAPVFTISPEQSVEDALLLMHEHGVRHLPVVADGRIEGIVSQRYLLRAKVESLDEDLGSLTAYLSADGFGG